MHTRRLGRLTGATAQRLLDGGDGPPPLPQLLAAATAPATAAELRGEATARAAFRSSTHSAPLPHPIPRRTPVHATSSIIIAKVIAAITLTASTAGGIALATTSTPADPHARTTSESTDTGDTTPSSLVIASPTSTGSLDDPENLTGSDGTAGTPRAGAPEAAGDAHGAVRATPSPKAPHPTGRCRAFDNLSDHDQAGKATQSPAFTDLSCTDAEAGTAAGSIRPTGRPDVAPGNPDQRTGKPDTARNANDGAEGEGKADRTRRPGRTTTPPTLRPTPTPTAAGPRTAGRQASTASTAESPAQNPAQLKEQVLPKPRWPPPFTPRSGRPARWAVVESGDPLPDLSDFGTRGNGDRLRGARKSSGLTATRPAGAEAVATPPRRPPSASFGADARLAGRSSPAPVMTEPGIYQRRRSQALGGRDRPNDEVVIVENAAIRQTHRSEPSS